MDGVRERKRVLRGEMRRRRASVPAALRAVWSRAIAARIESLPEWRDAGAVHLFIGALPGEVGTRALLDAAWREGKPVLCPRVAGDRIESYRVASPDDLAPGRGGLAEPDPARCERVAEAEADLILVPGLAFSEDGGRLGGGRGFYDRLLAGAAAPAIALAFELQMTGTLPLEAHDERVAAIVTELRAIRC